MTEIPSQNQIAEILYHHRFGCGDRHFAHNIYLYPSCGESDFLSVTKARYVHEMEIKRSRADLLADLRKPKHRESLLLTGQKKIPYNVQVGRPNYFWFVYPETLNVDITELPDYAGICHIYRYNGYYDSGWFCRVIRKPMRLHNERITDPQFQKLLEAMMFKYFRHVISGSQYQLQLEAEAS